MHVDTKLRFDNFVVGSANRLAVAAARAVGESPGSVYNPLFMYGGSGLGKTHLMSAIGNQVAQRQPALAVALVTLDDFVEELHEAVAGGDTEPFKQRRVHVPNRIVIRPESVFWTRPAVDNMAEAVRECLQQFP